MTSEGTGERQQNCEGVQRKRVLQWSLGGEYVDEKVAGHRKRQQISEMVCDYQCSKDMDEKSDRPYCGASEGKKMTIMKRERIVHREM